MCCLDDSITDISGDITYTWNAKTGRLLSKEDRAGHRIRGLNKLKDYIKNLKVEVVNYNT